MQVDNVNWRRYKALNYILQSYNWGNSSDEYLSNPQIKEILEDMLDEIRDKHKRDLLFEHLKGRSRFK